MLWFDRLELNGVNVYDPDDNKMIGVERLTINFRLSYLLSNNSIDIDGLFVEGAQVLITKVDATDTSRYLNINVFIDRLSEQYASNDTTSTGKSNRINIGEATVRQSSFIYIDADEDSIKDGFDYYHFALDVDEGQLERFVIQGDTTEFNLNTLIVKDRKTQFGVNHLSTFFRICNTSMEYTGVDLHAGKSTVTDTVIFKYKKMTDLGDFVDKVEILANLKNCSVEPRDLAVFFPWVKPLQQTLKLNGEIRGRVNKFKYTKMDFEVGHTRLHGSLEMEGLPDIYETFIVLNLKNSILDFADLSFILDERSLSQLKPLGHVAMQGQFLGYPNDFVANAKFNSKLGQIGSDINLKIQENNFDKAVYSGRLSLINFDLGQYLKDTVLYQKVNLDGRIKGSGLTSSTADFVLDGKINSIGINGYDYKKITTNARFASEFFNGVFNINDPNLKFQAKGSIDLREQRNIVKVQVLLDTAVLENLKLSSQKISLQSDIDINIKGLQIDSLVGAIDFKKSTIKYYDGELNLDRIHLVSEKQGKNRTVNLETTAVDAAISGNFLFSDISHDVNVLLKEVMLNIKNDKIALDNYYQTKKEIPKKYEAKFNVNLKNIKEITNLLDLNFGLSANVSIDGSFSSGYTTILHAYSKVDSLRYNGSEFYHSNFELTTSKISDSTNVLAMAFAESKKQVFGDNFQTENLAIEGIWNKSHIDFGIDADQLAQGNFIRLNGAIDFLEDSTQIKFQPSRLKVLERVWTFDPNNSILTSNRDWHIKNLTLLDSAQSISVNGYISEDPEKRLYLSIDQLNLSILNVITGQKFKGSLNAQASLKNYYSNATIENNIHVDSLTVNDFLVGDIEGKNSWDASEKRFNVNFFIDRLQKRMVNITGYYDPSDNTSPLNINATLEKANLKIIEPFLRDIFSNLGGSISGNYTIRGNLKQPDFGGQGTVNNGYLMVNYLKTKYQFEGNIGLSKNSVDFNEFVLTDALKNKAYVSGAITHHNFNNAYINLNSTFENFQVLNTLAKDNDLFFGIGYASGNVTFTGPLSNLKITANAKSEKNTRIFIPIGGSTSVEKKEFINFVNFSDSTFLKTLKKEVNKKLDLSGLSFDLNLDITPDAYCQIIIDIKSGDIIRGRGNGDLQLQLDTRGEFNMFGTFEFTEGWYNFTLYDIFNKEFEIQKGSRISWYGDPYAGNLNINASYNQLASLGPILTDQSLANSPQMHRKYPVQVILKLDGPMLSPAINFDIIAKDLPTVTVNNTLIVLPIEFNVFKSKLDEQELKRQVFSLIVLRRFSPSDAFNTSGSLTNSVSELFSNQLSNWMTQVDQNLEVDVDLGTFDQEAFNTFQLRLSRTFMNGRLRITRDGTFNNNTQNSANPNNSTNTSNIVGDWTVDYLLTADGKFKIKMYNRTNVNPILNTIGTQNTFTTGASILYTQSFNSLSELLQSARRRRQKELEEQKQQENQKQTAPNKDAIQKKEDEGTE